MSPHGTGSASLKSVLITGANGYVGGRLLQLLETDPRYAVRCLAREPRNVHPAMPGRVEVIAADLLQRQTLDPAFNGIDTAFFLVHALGSKSDFAELEQRMAENFVDAARAAGVRKIVYLGGLGSGAGLSAHLASRHSVGEILRASGIPTIELRASIILGSGSLSFELIRALAEKLPVMVTPRWANSLAQPISIEDVLQYLARSLEREATASEVFEIGGPDRVPYTALIKEYARQRGLKRVFVPVPVLTPYLSSLWLGLVTPVYARVGAKLIDGLRNDTVLTNDDARHAFDIVPMPYAAAIARAMVNEDREVAATRWHDARSSSGARTSWGGMRLGSRIVEVRSTEVPVSVERAFEPIQRIGGETGWYYGNILWRLRGALDLAVGGVGMRRSRPRGRSIRIGDAIDFWRVEELEDDRLLRLRAEMKLPGRAWLQFEVSPVKGGRSLITQTAIFDPRGLWGLLYWYLLYPAHALIFRGMIARIGAAASNS